jgi:RimJ/RimL family protein N-acetyltransferase
METGNPSQQVLARRRQVVNPADYGATERLRDGRTLHIRAVRPTDRDALLAAFERTSSETRYRRFFGPKKTITAPELDRATHVDFINEVALVALLDEEDGSQTLAGSARYVVTEPGRAEVAFTVDDQHQNLGIGTRLMRHLARIADEAGLQELHAEVLADNTPMLKVFEHAGLEMHVHHHAGIANVRLDLSHKNQTKNPN